MLNGFLKPRLSVIALALTFFLQPAAAFDRDAALKTIRMSVADVKAKAQDIPYSSLARDPHNWLGAVVTFRGEVVQVMEDGLDVILRVNVTKDIEFDSWRDTVLVFYTKASASESRILEHDIVRLWGGFVGIETYKAIFGNPVSIPAVIARVIVQDGQNVSGVDAAVAAATAAAPVTAASDNQRISKEEEQRLRSSIVER
ncbi:hypothetical protein ACVW1C_007519 [Bradyrhizobium sp. USDA 4011]